MKKIEELTDYKLHELYVQEGWPRQKIADYYGVSKKKIDYLLSKYGINLYKKRVADFLNKLAGEQGISTEQFLKGIDLFNNYSIEDISRALVHYYFRNGPVEGIHSDGKLTQEDMKILNKFCYNKIYTFLTLIKKNDLVNLLLIIESGSLYGKDWDSPKFEID